MAQSMIGGLIENGIESRLIRVGEPDLARRQELVANFKIKPFLDNFSAIKNSDVVIFAVKPQIIRDVISPLTDYFIERKSLLLSIAAGISIKNIESWVSQDTAIVRAMPNSASLVRGGITALCSNSKTSREQLDRAESIMLAVGKTVWLQDEVLMDAVTAISGSGPAYFFYLMEALEQAAIIGGLDKKTARLLTLETALGAARLATETNQSPSSLRKMVTSPGGTTEAAMEVLDHNSAVETIKEAVLAAQNRSRDLENPPSD